MAEALKDRLNEDVKSAMRERDKLRLGTLRLIMAGIKQREVDERISLDDAAVVAVLDKMAKQRRESIEQYTKANRQDLVDQESFELGIIQGYMPAQLDQAELDALIAKAIADSGATGIKDMGKVMASLRPQVQGRADMGALSARVKQRLG